MTRARLAGLHLALAAMLLRALLPVGWMPDLGGSAPIIICSMDGSGQHHEQSVPGKPSPNDGKHSHEECPFAAAPHVAAPVLLGHLAAPSLAGHAVNVPDIPAVFVSVAEYDSHSPRAPPRFA
jgi:hypothetical protein